MNNFHGCDAIMKGLNHPAVQRLRATRNGLPHVTSVVPTLFWIIRPNSCQLEVDLSLKLAGFHLNYKDATKGVPIIPFLNAFLTELQQLEENHPSYFQKDRVVVNFQKCWNITQIVRYCKSLKPAMTHFYYSQIQQCLVTSNGYDWSVNLAIAEIIQVEPVVSDKLFKEVSYVLEPPGYPQKIIA